MPKDSKTSKPTAGIARRTYTPEFKAQLVAACQQPGASVATLATQHAMNASVLHRWLKEHQHSGRHQLTEPLKRTLARLPPQSPAFIAMSLPPASPVPEQDVKIELRKGTLSMALTWPVSAADDLT